MPSRRLRVAVALAGIIPGALLAQLVPTGIDHGSPIVVLTGAGTVGRADPLDSFTGRFVIDPGAGAAIPAAIERTVAPMNLVVRTVARRRLTRLNKPWTRFEIAVNGANIDFQYPGEPVVRLPRTGAEINWQNAEGEAMRVQLPGGAAADGTVLREQYHTRDGERINEYRLEQGGSVLRVAVTVTGPRLTIPLTYSLAYRRE